MATFELKWWLDGTEPPRYLDLDASLAKFQELVSDALRREQIDVNVVPATVVLSRTISYHGRLAAELPPRAANLVSAIWEEGYWQVFEPPGETGDDPQE